MKHQPNRPAGAARGLVTAAVQQLDSTRRLAARVRHHVSGGLAAAAALTYAAAPAAAYALSEHTVVSGETLSGISSHYGVPVATLAALNGILNPDLILAGQVLRVGDDVATAEPGQESPWTYTVQAGDTLSGIALRFGTTVSALVTVNEVIDEDVVLVGQMLWLGTKPAGAAPVAATPRRHVVVAGETLSHIAAQYGTTVQALADANAIDDVNHVVAGSSILVSAAGQAAGSIDARAALRRAAGEFGVDPSLVLAIAWQESGWNQSMVSPAGAIGVMQVIPETGDWAAADLVGGAYNWRTDVADNARVGTAVLRDLLLATGWDVPLSVGAYYQGLRSIRTYGIYGDTELYVENVLALAERMD